MSISDELTRIQQAKTSLIEAIEDKGYEVPTGALISDLPTYVENIPSPQVLTITGGDAINPGWQTTFGDINELTITGTNLSYMFYNYKGATLPTLKGSTSSVTSMVSMFQECVNVTNFDLSNFDTSHVTSMNSMFKCTSGVRVRRLDLSNFNTSSLMYASSMFNGLYQLAVLDISNFDFSHLTSFSSMFSSCGTTCSVSDGAYANKIPYVYVKDATAQDWVLTQSNGHPASWSTNNVLIKSQIQQ